MILLSKLRRHANLGFPKKKSVVSKCIHEISDVWSNGEISSSLVITDLVDKQGTIAYFKESARIGYFSRVVDVLEIERVSAANKCDF